MSISKKLLCAVYALLAVAALYLTWSNNLAFMADAPSGLDGLSAFSDATHANFAASSIAWDLAAACIARTVVHGVRGAPCRHALCLGLRHPVAAGSVRGHVSPLPPAPRNPSIARQRSAGAKLSLTTPLALCIAVQRFYSG